MSQTTHTGLKRIDTMESGLVETAGSPSLD
jgi:hypothetical protein